MIYLDVILAPFLTVGRPSNPKGSFKYTPLASTRLKSGFGASYFVLNLMAISIVTGRIVI